MTDETLIDFSTVPHQRLLLKLYCEVIVCFGLRTSTYWTTLGWRSGFCTKSLKALTKGLFYSDMEIKGSVGFLFQSNTDRLDIYYGLIKLKRLLDCNPLLFKAKENGDCHTPFRLVRRSRLLQNAHASKKSEWRTKVMNDNDCSTWSERWKSWQVTTASPLLISGLTFFSYPVGSRLLVT